MKQALRITATLLALLAVLCPTGAAQTVIAGGSTIALNMQTDGVHVVEFCEAAAQRAGLERGDRICAVDGEEIHTVQELKQAVQRGQGKPMQLTVRRGEHERKITLAASKKKDGWQLGILVRDTISGIGTLTFYDPATGCFGALGHGISDGKHLIALKGGQVSPSLVASVHRGKRGDPGTLHGAVKDGTGTGEIFGNTPQGVFGKMEPICGSAVEIAGADQVHTGDAVIRCNVRGNTVEEFRVRIRALYPRDGSERNLLLQVTDERLLELTGGIVQGMSGSPILQDGKLIGAVTHVLIDDPTRGYGIFIENMLQAMTEANASVFFCSSTAPRLGHSERAQRAEESFAQAPVHVILSERSESKNLFLSSTAAPRFDGARILRDDIPQNGTEGNGKLCPKSAFAILRRLCYTEKNAPEAIGGELFFRRLSE